MKLFEPHRKKKPRIEIIPMIDVMLLLLVYYVLSTVAMGHLEGIPVDLPKAATGEVVHARADVALTITRDGDFYFNKIRLNANHLSDDLAAAASALDGGMDALHDANITINADMSVQHRLVVRAMDELRKLGVTHFGIATDPPGAP